jgi:hypothetical protein
VVAEFRKVGPGNTRKGQKEGKRISGKCRLLKAK